MTFYQSQMCKLRGLVRDLDNKTIELNLLFNVNVTVTCVIHVIIFISHSLSTASIAFIFQPIGSILSGIVLEPLGRKKSMILVNIPHIIGWFLLYSASSITQLFVAGMEKIVLTNRS